MLPLRTKFLIVKSTGYQHPESHVSTVQETEPLDIIIVRRGQRTTGEAYILLRMPIQVEMVLRKDKTYLGKRYVEVNLAKKLVRTPVCVTVGLEERVLPCRLVVFLHYLPN